MVNILELLKRCSDGGWDRQSRHQWASLSLIRPIFVITKLIDLLSIDTRNELKVPQLALLIRHCSLVSENI